MSSLISEYYFDQYVVPLLPGGAAATSFLDVLSRLAVERRDGSRPISIGLLGDAASRIGPLLARELVEAGEHRFHIDCLGASDRLALAAHRQARELGVVGYLTLLTPEDHIPIRAPGTYDLLYSRNRLHQEDGREELLEAVERAMTPASLLVVDEPIGSPFVEAEPAEDIVGYFCSKLLPRHRTRWEPEEARARPRDSGLLAALGKRFSAASVTPFGGIADPFVDATTGLVFSAGQPEDRRFVEFLVALEKRLRSELPPTRVFALLKRHGTVGTPARFPELVSSRNQLVVPEDMGFDFSTTEELFSVVLDGTKEVPLLSLGFHDWEPDNQHRWTGPVLGVTVDLPEFEDPVRCRLVVHCHEPTRPVGGAATLYVDGARVGRIEEVYAALAGGGELPFEFVTHGGRVAATAVFEKAQKPADATDDRELAVAVHRIAAHVLWDPPSAG